MQGAVEGWHCRTTAKGKTDSNSEDILTNLADVALAETAKS